MNGSLLHQNHAVPLLVKRADGLRPTVVELSHLQPRKIRQPWLALRLFALREDTAGRGTPAAGVPSPLSARSG